MENFFIALKLMGLGMSGIFAVILTIMVVVAILTRVCKPKPEEPDGK